MTHPKSDPYAAVGVNINAGAQAVQLMTSTVQSTYNPAVLSSPGGFGGLFSAAALQTMQAPVLVASTDGVGTKVALGIKADRLEALGQDIVNHCVNDILVQNAKPLFFMDYIASAALDPHQIARIVSGMAEACKAVDCALLGGETAEMPGVYRKGQLDIAGTMVGVAERAHLLPKTNCHPGDIIWGLAASGPHTNGYSLLRKLFVDMPLNLILPELGQSLADALLAPHRCYLPVLEQALAHPTQPIKALAHITGGGFVENIPRVLPKGIYAAIEPHSWPIPPLFQLVQTRSKLPFKQLWRILNMGIGMILITAPDQADLLKTLIQEPCWKIGTLCQGTSAPRYLSTLE